MVGLAGEVAFSILGSSKTTVERALQNRLQCGPSLANVLYGILINLPPSNRQGLTQIIDLSYQQFFILALNCPECDVE